MINDAGTLNLKKYKIEAEFNIAFEYHVETLLKSHLLVYLKVLHECISENILATVNFSADLPDIKTF